MFLDPICYTSTTYLRVGMPICRGIYIPCHVGKEAGSMLARSYPQSQKHVGLVGHNKWDQRRQTDMGQTGKMRRGGCVMVWLLFLCIVLCIYVVFYRVKKEKSNKVLIVLGGNIGDGLLNAPALKALVSHYESVGKEVYCFCIKPVKAIYKRMPELNKIKYMDEEYGIYMPMTLNKTIETFSDAVQISSEMAQVRRSLSGVSFDCVIGFMYRNLKATLLLLGRRGKENYFLDPMPCGKSIPFKCLRAFISRFCYMEMDDEDIQKTEHIKLFLQRIGIKDYETRIPYIPERPKHEKFIYPNGADYITISVDSSVAQRRWPVESFIALINIMLEKYDYTIVLTGTNVTQEISDKYSRAFDNNSRVISYIGILTLDNWIELLRNSRFHIGVDSGPIHVAAAVGTKAFCLVGVYDGNRYFPYKMDKEVQGVSVPETIYGKDVESLRCRGCVSVSGIGSGNKECLDRCKQGQPCVCLEKITVDDVMFAIEKARRDGAIQ